MGAYDNILFYLSDPKYAAYMKALVIYGSGPGFSKPEARVGWNKNADKLSSDYATKGLEALVGSDREKGHRTAIGLVHSAKNVFGQRDDDPLYARMPHGAYVAAKSLDKLLLPTLIIIGERDKGFRGSSEMMKKKIVGSDLIVVPDAGHMCCEKAPVAFNDFIENGIAQLGLKAKM